MSTWKEENAEIAKRVEAIVDSGMGALHRALSREFGRCAVSQAKLWEIESEIMAIAEDAAKAGRDVIADARNRETQQASANMLGTALAVARMKDGS